jgi:predicted NBD/HSP70 family sugar kinase
MSSTDSVLARDVFDSNGRGLQHNGLRRANERAVLTIIGFNPGVSNADISRHSGLAPQTVSAILTELDDAGLIRRGDVLRGRRGQPATPLHLNPHGAFSVGIEVSWRHVEVVLINFHGEVIASQHDYYLFPDAATLPDKLVEMIGLVTAGLSVEQRRRLTDIGLTLPSSLVEKLPSLGADVEQVALWGELELGQVLRNKTACDVSTFNDGNAACWAELIAFEKPRPSNLTYFLLSHYISAGVLGDGVLWEGPSLNSANIGAMLVTDAAGKLQHAHDIASLSALSARLSAAGHNMVVEDLQNFDWANCEDVLADWIEASANALSKVIFNVSTVIDSRLVVLDSLLPRHIVERLVNRLDEHFKALPVASFTPPQVMMGHLGANAPAQGAAELTLYRRFFSRSISDLIG